MYRAHLSAQRRPNLTDGPIEPTGNLAGRNLGDGTTLDQGIKFGGQRRAFGFGFRQPVFQRPRPS
jgi:hypothetical protein